VNRESLSCVMLPTISHEKTYARNIFAPHAVSVGVQRITRPVAATIKAECAEPVWKGSQRPIAD
jgi:hypothetical protein